MKTITVSAENGQTFSGYLKEPAGRPKGLVLVVQEIYGVNREIRRMVDAYAEAGYVAFAPDILWRVSPGLDFAYEDRDGARDAVMSLKADQITADIVASGRELSDTYGAGLPVAIVAAGWGGKFALDAAGKTDCQSVVCFYPGNLEGSEDLTLKVDAPMQFHFAFHDFRTKPEFRTKLRSMLADRDNVEIYVYSQADHGFANRDRTEFHEASALLADSRAIEFLDRTLAKSAN